MRDYFLYSFANSAFPVYKLFFRYMTCIVWVFMLSISCADKISLVSYGLWTSSDSCWTNFLIYLALTCYIRSQVYGLAIRCHVVYILP